MSYNTNFFVLGLPRSRTAWLANFMTYGQTFCHHEGMNGCRSMAEYKAKLGSDGDSGTGLMMFDLDYHFPGCRKVIIESSPSRCIEFIDREFGNGEELTYFLKDKLDRVQGLRIPFEEIDDRLEQIWNYLSDEPFNKKRADMLKEFNIQLHDLSSIDFDSAESLLIEEPADVIRSK